jgi:hypothetical protein
MSDYSGASPDICRRAFSRFVHPIILEEAEQGTLNKYAGCIVVLNPAVPYEPKYRHAIEDGLFDELILWAHTVGNPQIHDIPRYKRIAYAKAFTSFLTGLPSHAVQQQFPELYVPGMTKYGGSAVRGVGPIRLVTAFSGVEWYFDLMISEMMGSAISALCHEEMVAVMASDEDMILPPAES